MADSPASLGTTLAKVLGGGKGWFSRERLRRSTLVRPLGKHGQGAASGRPAVNGYVICSLY